MTSQLQRLRKIATRKSSVLGGVGLLAGIWLFGDITQHLGEWVPSIVLGSGLAWFVLKSQAARLTGEVLPRPASLTVTRVKTALVEAEGVVDRLAAEVKDVSSDGSAQQLFALRNQINQIVTELHRDEIRLAVMGGKGVGKSTLTELLQSTWIAEVSQTLSLQDTPELFAIGTGAETAAWKIANTADLVMFVTGGDLTASELQAIQRLTGAYKRTLLVFNKQDQYLPAEQDTILQQLRARTQGILAAQDVLAITTDPRPTKVRQHQPDGSFKEWLEQPEPDIRPLTDRLSHILLKEGKQLVVASSFGQVQEVKQSAQQALHTVWRARALPMIEQAQWIAAGTAFANPFPALDLLATAAINAQMVFDLSQHYHQKFTFDQAKTIATTLAGSMVKLGLVEISTQAIATVLKTNFITFVAGGAIQGVSAAYLTRMAGLTLIEYFESDASQGRIRPDLLQKIMRRVFQDNQRGAFLQAFVQQGVDRLSTAPKPFTSLPAVTGPIDLPPLEAHKMADQPLQSVPLPESVNVAAP